MSHLKIGGRQKRAGYACGSLSKHRRSLCAAAPFARSSPLRGAPYQLQRPSDTASQVRQAARQIQRYALISRRVMHIEHSICRANAPALS